ncbi:hypothetical protein ACIP1G_03975 [Pseudomonas sp. NPDC089392]|uniref:hypothetical protein n=1 Tax=Pseudomonas sp. NPDC089392 TaxID=3364459 RepID=UPI00381CF31B
MTSRRILTSQELQEIYSAAPFTYNFEDILSWDSPFTLPITPPSIIKTPDKELIENATSIAQQVMHDIEATTPLGTPGLEEHLAKHYSVIERAHPEKLHELYKKNNTS